MAAAVICGLIALALFWRSDEACRRWQRSYVAAAEENQGGAFDFINQGPLAQMRSERPDGCAVPDVR